MLDWPDAAPKVRSWLDRAPLEASKANEEMAVSDERKQLPAVIRGFLGDTAADFAEVALDCVLDAGVLKELPGVGIVVRAATAGKSAYDAILLGKFMAFAMHVDDATAEQRTAWSASLAEPGERESLQRNVLLLVERLDDVEKAPLLARSFNACVACEISRRGFQHHALIILSNDFLGLRILNRKRGSQSDFQLPFEIAQPLISHGLFQPRQHVGSFLVGDAADERASLNVRGWVTPFAARFLEIVFGPEEPDEARLKDEENPQ